jgi:hypothetical protein
VAQSYGTKATLTEQAQKGQDLFEVIAMSAEPPALAHLSPSFYAGELEASWRPFYFPGDSNYDN